MPIPDSILQPLTDVLNDTLAQNIAVDDRPGIITGVQIGDGQMTVTGRPRSE